jgi:hypothetical protein
VSDLGRAIRRTPGAVGALVLRAGERIEGPAMELLPGLPFYRRRPLMAFTIVDVDHTAASITIGGAPLPRTPQPARLPGDANG